MSSKRVLQRTIGLAIVALLIIGREIASSETPTTFDAYRADPTPVMNGRVDVGGYKLNINCLGDGSPTVIFDTGLGIAGNQWTGIQWKIAELTRACYYDRAGLGRSDPPPKVPVTTQDMVKDLHTLLRNANIAGPYVLVAHSMAGFNARLYASQYPQDVVGMVLVECSHPDLEARWLAALPPESPDESSGLKELRQFLVEEIYAIIELEGPEFVDWKTSEAQVRASGSLGSIPLVVLTAGDEKWEADFPPELWKILDQEWLQMQKEMAALSPTSTHIIVENSSHLIHWDQPGSVIDAIRSVVKSAQSE